MYGGYLEGVFYLILLVNCFVLFIDKFVRNRVFGEVVK